MAENWSDDELAAAVAAYREMEKLESARKTYVKRKFYRDLAQRFGRAEKAFERRMMNISAVLDELGQSWIPGLPPAKNVGSNVKSRIATLLKSQESDSSTLTKAGYKAKLPAMRDWLIEVARHEGKVTYGQVMTAFGIDRFSLRHALGFLGNQAKKFDEPIITALVVGNKTQRCSSGFAKEFGINDDETERLRLYEFWGRRDTEQVVPEPESTDLEVKAARFVSVEARPDQAAFRREVYLACNGKCVISGCDVVQVLDAAHKHGRSWRLGHNRAEDGYLLRKDLHALYDNKLLWITDNGKVALDSSVMEHYRPFSGKALLV